MADIQMVNRGGAERIVEIDVLRGFTIILMILGHSFIVHPIDIHSVPWCMALHNWIYSFHMELFFLLSGCVYHCSSYVKYIIKKIDRILVPYLFFGIIALLLHSSGSDMVNKGYSLGEGITKMLLYGGSYWFLYTLFLLYLIYPLIETICNKPWKEIALAVICMVVIELIPIPNILNLNRIVYYIPYFVFGRYIMRFVKSDTAKQHWVNAIIASVALVLYLGIEKIGADCHILQFVRALSMISFLYVLSHYMVAIVNNGNKVLKLAERFLCNCSKYSLQLYLFNGFILVAIRVVVCSILHFTNPAIIVSTILIGNILITLLICNYILPHTRVLSWLCGTGKRPWENK